MDYLDIIKENRWTVNDPTAWDSAANYLGADYSEYYIVIGVNRDSDVLGRANWQSACEELPETEDGQSVVIAEFSHWACGWHRLLLVHENAPVELLTIAGEIVSDLADYSILNEDLYCRMEHEEYVEHLDNWALNEAAAMFGCSDIDLLSDEVKERFISAVLNCFYSFGGPHLDKAVIGRELSSDDMRLLAMPIAGRVEYFRQPISGQYSMAVYTETDVDLYYWDPIFKTCHHPGITQVSDLGERYYNNILLPYDIRISFDSYLLTHYHEQGE